MLQKETRCIKRWLLKTFEQDEDFQLFSFVEIYFFSIYYCPSEATEDTCMFPGRQIKYNYLDLQIQKVFTPRLLMHRVFFWSISECLNLFNSCVWVPQLSSVWKDGSQNHTVTAGKGSNMQKCWKLQNLQNVEDLSEEQCSVQLFRTNKGLMNNQHKTKEQSWIIQVTSHSIKNQGFPNFWRGLFE